MYLSLQNFGQIKGNTLNSHIVKIHTSQFIQYKPYQNHLLEHFIAGVPFDGWVLSNLKKHEF